MNLFPLRTAALAALLAMALAALGALFATVLASSLNKPRPKRPLRLSRRPSATTAVSVPRESAPHVVYL